MVGITHKNIDYDADLGESGWSAILPQRIPYAELSADIEADYCIVGAGFAGLAAARRVLQIHSNARVVMLEAATAGSGPAGRNSGFMIDLPHVLSSSSYAGQAASDQRDIKLNRQAIDFVRKAVDEFGLSADTFRAEGKVNAAASRSGILANQEYSEHLSKLGEACELLDAKAMQAISGSNYYLGGLRTPGTAMIQPALLVRGIADGLASMDSCELYERTAVLSIQQQADRWKLSTAKGSVLASKTILAVNGFVENFGFYQRRLMHVNLYASMTRELSAGEVSILNGQDRWGFTPSDPFGTTVRKINDNGGHRLIIRNRFTYDPGLVARSSQLQRAAHDHDKALLARFPALTEVSMQYRWSGRLCLSRNHSWALGQVAENLYSACCQDGLGTTKGTVAGVIAAELACELHCDSLMPEFENAELPQQLPPEPFMTVGARTYLKWREWRAGKDR
ncbi:MAG: FAD-binding oxidoreductase [Aestuariibacter sp.]|nr:FAD-binding oxidoreductase [Aestuariibacter sp.]